MLNKTAPIQVEDTDLRRVITQIYDDLNEIINKINYSSPSSSSTNVDNGTIRVLKNDTNSYSIEIKTEDGWFVTKPDTLVQSDNVNREENTLKSIQVSNFLNSWENYGKKSTSLSFYKDKERVYIQGAVKSGTPGDQSVIFTLPQGYRPEDTVVYSVISSGTNLARIHIRNNGDVVSFAEETAGKSNKFLSLDGISFKIRE